MENKKEYKKALEKINTINNYWIALGSLYVICNFIFSNYSFSLAGIRLLIYDTVTAESFWYLFFGDSLIRCVYFYYKIEEIKTALFSSMPFGIGWLYTKFKLKHMKP